MIEAAEAIIEAVGGLTREEFYADQRLQYAVLWCFTKLGESASTLTPELRTRHATVSWRDASAFRNRAVHGYFDIEADIVLNAARQHVPQLIEDLRAVLAKEFPEELT
ncbi:MAG TPA: HepT-like ribonuclease domain-containing protein [Mycobacteriales bacterium]|nr:HepT-like ribonuclease domain-containing protein [Mycobacteriales bacterium]